MKTLILLRHAKASWKNVDLDDFDRPLNKRGIESATILGEWMRDNDLWPDRVLCSSAVRTQTTWEHLANVGGIDIEGELRPELYLAKAEDLMRAIRTAPDSSNRLAIVGHNPGLGMVAAQLCVAVLLDRLKKIGGFPTSAYAEFDFEVDSWREVEPQTGILVRMETPKTIKEKA